MKSPASFQKIPLVWIVEDDHDLRSGYESIINESGKFEVGHAFRTGDECIAALKKQRPPDFILMDIELPGRNGIQCTAVISALYPSVKIIMVTVYEDNEMVFEALKAGASGYITKNSNFVQLISALEEIQNGGAPMSSKIARMVIEDFHMNPKTPLSRRETEVLQMVASGKTFAQIANELFIARETTKSHVRNIYSKLQVNCKAEAIEKASKQHYI